MQLETAALSHQGNVRDNNEDRYLLDSGLGLFGVADGVGGLPGGAEAAECAIETVRAKARAAHIGDLSRIVEDANTAVQELATKVSPDIGMGSTLTVGWFRNGILTLANVGDSRCYRLRKGHLSCLTTDDSVENEVLRRRARGEHIAVSRSQLNALTKCVGQPDQLAIPTRSEEVEPGDVYLFVTDGIARVLVETELATCMSANLKPMAILQAMINKALLRGGPDNATGVLVRVLSV